jgi:hypothetical protein
MIKTLYFLPGFRRVASPAARGISVRKDGHHAGSELALVRILMTNSTASILEVISHQLRWSESCPLPVTLCANNGRVCPHQRIPAGSMPSQREGGGLESLVAMTAFTAIVVRRAAELTPVDVLVTSGAGNVLNSINHSVCIRNMTLGARHIDVSRLERKTRCGVLRDAEGRGLEAVHSVTGRAIFGIRPPGKLSFVRISLMAICALGKSHWLFEVCSPVAGIAWHVDVLSLKRISSLEMIEDGGNLRRFPVYGRQVARFAAGFKRSLVRILVTRSAVFEGDAFVFCIRPRIFKQSVAFLARNFFVTSRQAEARPFVLELSGIFPLQGVVAVGALCG